MHVYTMKGVALNSVVDMYSENKKHSIVFYFIKINDTHIAQDVTTAARRLFTFGIVFMIYFLDTTLRLIQNWDLHNNTEVCASERLESRQATVKLTQLLTQLLNTEHLSINKCTFS